MNNQLIAYRPTAYLILTSVQNNSYQLSNSFPKQTPSLPCTYLLNPYTLDYLLKLSIVYKLLSFYSLFLLLILIAIYFMLFLYNLSVCYPISFSIYFELIANDDKY